MGWITKSDSRAAGDQAEPELLGVQESPFGFPESPAGRARSESGSPLFGRRRILSGEPVSSDSRAGALTPTSAKSWRLRAPIRRAAGVGAAGEGLPFPHGKSSFRTLAHGLPPHRRRPDLHFQLVFRPSKFAGFAAIGRERAIERLKNV